MNRPAQPNLTRRSFLAATGGVGALALGLPPSALAAGATPDAQTAALDVLTGDYPRAWYFRQTEDSQLFDSYEDWKAHFQHLNGVQGKAFLEERDFDDVRTREFFTRFKQEHPEKIVLLHFNGKCRRPSFNGEAFFPGHWLYYAGTTVTAPADASADTLQVADTSVVRMERPPVLPEMPDDLVIVPPGADGLNWAGAEFARLTAIEGPSLTVQRGQFGSTPIDVPEGSYLAAVVRQRPPALPPPQALWLYNFSSIGLRDAEGRRCIDVLADELAGYFGPGGVLEAYDGLEFDVMYFLPDGRPQGRRFAIDQEFIDVDNDGVPDAQADLAPGYVDGTNVYGIGMTEFCQKLRQGMPDKLIMADQIDPLIQQRSFGYLSGMEAEGFPTLRDPGFADWSGGLNRFEFWKRRGTRPSLNYQVFKYQRDENKPGVDPDAFKRLRLALAAAQFTDSAFALGGGWAPPPIDWNGVDVQVFDELWLGDEQRINWLGQPVGEAVHLATSAPNLLAGRLRRLLGRPLELGASAGVSADTGAPLHFVDLGQVEVGGPDLFVVLALQGAPLVGYPDSIARRLAVRVYTGGSTEASGEFYSWLDDSPATSTFAFRGLTPGAFRLELEVEGSEQVTINRLTAHAYPDAMYRLFEHGLVLGNPSEQPFTFNLDEIAPRQSYRRFRGVESQDPVTNNGEPAGAEVTIAPLDGLFLVTADG